MTVFKFKQFTIIQEQSAMKVGTDGVLLGSWVACKKPTQILDVGCGTGLISLMLAQRTLDSKITGIEIDQKASEEARLNANNSNWSDRIEIFNSALQDFSTNLKFDLIISNPPFFPANQSKDKRDIARHTNRLSFEELIANSKKLLTKKGVICVILPSASAAYFSKLAEFNKLYCQRACYVKGNEQAEVKRVMLEFSFNKCKVKIEHLIIEKSRHVYTDDYIKLCHPFYLNM